MTTEERLVKYVNDITRGVVTISPRHAADIMLICAEQTLATVIFYRFDTNNFHGNKSGVWIKNHKIEVEEVLMLDIVSKQPETILFEPTIDRRFYKYECLDSKGIMKAIIYTSNNMLF